MHLFTQKSVPTNQNLLYETEKQAKLALVGDLDMCINEQGLIYNAAFDSSKVFYGQNYDNCQYNSSMFSDYISSQIEWLLPYIPQKSIVVEVGCGKGFYAESLASKRIDCQIYGFDSSYSGEQSKLTNLHFYKEYYSENHASIKPDFVISRHVIEHISKPSVFLKSIRKTMQNGAMLFLETPDSEWILKNNVIYDFFYEHCSYFTENSLENMLSKSGLESIEIEKEFGGQYMWFLARANDKHKTKTSNDTSAIKRLCEQYIKNRDENISVIKKKMRTLNGKYAFIWGAGAKGVTFVNIFDPQKIYIKGVIDINPCKQGKFIAKTGHPVIAPVDLAQQLNNACGGGIILLLNENYYSEVKNMLCQMNIDCNLEIL
jgi:SAM-dependent methyltransferase